MRYTIPRWDTGEAIWSGEAKSMRDAAEQAVRAGVSLFQAELCGADLRRAILCGADLGGADLRRALLTDADLDGADLSRADLTDADLRGARLVGASLTDANLTGARFVGASLTGADLRGARLVGADLTGAYLARTDLTGVDLSGAIVAPGLTWQDLRAQVDARDLRLRVAEYIEQHPALHDQGDWGDDSDDPDCGTPCCVAGWACRLGGGTRGMRVPTAATLLLHIDGVPMPSFVADATRADILAALRAEVTP